MASTLRAAAYLASGGDSTVMALKGAEANGDLGGIRCRLVIVSTPRAGVIKKLLDSGFPKRDIVIIPRREFADEMSFGDAIIDNCRSRRIEVVGQFGWLPFTPANVIEAYPGRIINQHPGALDPAHATQEYPHPDFGGPGMHGLATVAAAVFFSRMAGRKLPLEATTHHVGTKLDAGDIIARAQMEFDSGETPVELQKRLLPIEHRVQIGSMAYFGRFGRFPTWHRQPPLIYDDELPLLAKAKTEARRYVQELEGVP